MLHTFLIVRKNRLKILIPIILLILVMSLLKFYPASHVFLNPIESEELKIEIERIYNERSSCLVSGSLLPLRELFDLSQKYGQWSLEHEVMRVKYLKDWSLERGIKFTNIESSVRIKKIYHRASTIRISLEETYKFDYIYLSDSKPVTNSFGVGIRHTLDLVEKNENWLIYSDWYTDCFEDATSHYSGEIREDSSSITPYANPDAIEASSGKPYYNRQKAVEYADKYCGAAWGSGNNFKYNKKYMDYNGIGGDCSNFVSQALGDPEGGGLPQDGSWHAAYPKYGAGSGSYSWVNADGLRDYLIYSGIASTIKRGTFKELTAPAGGHPGGFVDMLQPGDLVCYEKNLNIDHFGIVTARDSHGYLLINSHTTDRYHVPWDLGWSGSNIRFVLLHING